MHSPVNIKYPVYGTKLAYHNVKFVMFVSITKRTLSNGSLCVILSYHERPLQNGNEANDANVRRAGVQQSFFFFFFFLVCLFYLVQCSACAVLPQRPGGITVIQSSYLMVSSGNNNFLTCTNGNRYIGNIKVLKFYLVVGTNVDEMGWDGIEKDVRL